MGDGGRKGGAATRQIGALAKVIDKARSSKFADVTESVDKDGKKIALVRSTRGKLTEVTPETAKSLVHLSLAGISASRGKVSLTSDIRVGKKGLKTTHVTNLQRKEILKIYNKATGKNYKNWSSLSKSVAKSRAYRDFVKSARAEAAKGARSDKAKKIITARGRERSRAEDKSAKKKVTQQRQRRRKATKAKSQASRRNLIKKKKKNS